MYQSTKLDAREYNYHVSSCNFDSVNTQGSVHLETNNTAIKFLIETTLFNNCSNTANGGCISYIQEGEFIQDRICSYSSRIDSEYDYGVYCFIHVTNLSEFKNFIHDSSISKSGYKD